MKYEFCGKYTVPGEIGISGEHSNGRLFWHFLRARCPLYILSCSAIMESSWSVYIHGPARWVGCVSVDFKQHKYVMAKNHALEALIIINLCFSPVQSIKPKGSLTIEPRLNKNS